MIKLDTENMGGSELTLECRAQKLARLEADVGSGAGSELIGILDSELMLVLVKERLRGVDLPDAQHMRQANDH